MEATDQHEQAINPANALYKVLKDPEQQQPADAPAYYYYDTYPGDNVDEGQDYPSLEQLNAHYANKAKNIIAQKPIIEAIIKKKMEAKAAGK